MVYVAHMDVFLNIALLTLEKHSSPPRRYELSMSLQKETAHSYGNSLVSENFPITGRLGEESTHMYVR